MSGTVRSSVSITDALGHGLLRELVRLQERAGELIVVSRSDLAPAHPLAQRPLRRRQTHEHQPVGA